ncbi:MAG: acyl-CoA desaturase [Bacteroidota bacterium]|nr:acyl-CoA desaturase [Bacteroidota bacterium]
MTGVKLNVVRFAAPGKDSFHETVIDRVKTHFSKRDISPYANTGMWVKTAVMLLLYFVPYAFIVSGLTAGSTWLFFGCWFLIAWGMIGIGTSVVHDANHGAYSPNRKVNDLIGFILEIIGGYTITWKIQHNQLHHTYTNITGLDEDIDSIKLLRFSPRQPYYWYHRYQHIYIWFFYMIMTLYWMTVKDFRQVVRYKQHNLLARYNISYGKALTLLTLYKVLYYTYIIVLPIIFSGFPWYYIIGGFLFAHFIAGVVLSCIFQPAHVVEASTFALPLESEGKRRMEDSWAIHEVENTTNFAPRNRLLTWFIGGLNYQIEHHLFTGICHVHYPQLAPIVKSAAEDFGVAYNVEPTYWQALRGHLKMLKKLGEG